MAAFEVRLLLSLLLLSTGCSISKFNRPPMWGSAVTTHSRFFGLKADIPMGGTTVIGIHLGWGSSTWAVIPVSTNELFTATISDTFSLGQGISPFDTQIKEDLQTGWKGTPPTPRLKFFVEPPTPK